MNGQDSQDIITRLEARIKAQQKTIDVLMEAAERRISEGQSPVELLSRNLSLEKVVQHKTESLQRQGEELKKALYDLQLTQARLLHAQKLESVGQLAAGIAHEINTPAQFIGSNIEFLEKSFDDLRRLIESLLQMARNPAGDPPKASSERDINRLLADIDWEYLKAEIPLAVRQSKEGIGRITTIVKALKEFSHPSSRDKAMYDLNRIIETTITVASNEWKYCAEVETRLDPELPKVFCLADEIGQAVLNILINAAHAVAGKGRKEGEKGRITVSTRSCPEHVEISVEDDGTGIPENIRSRIFDPFFTTKMVGEGTGQGLAITHDVIEKKHGGTLSFTSETGKGTTFVIHLPLAAS